MTTSTLPMAPKDQPRMTAANPVNLVHEAEAQRQFVRVRIPATVKFRVGVEEREHALHDISSGGFSFDIGNRSYRLGDRFTGQLTIRIDSVGFSIPVNFDIRTLEADGTRVACVFQNLGAAEIAALRQIITSYLGGELITANDMLATLSRENFVKQRGNRLGGGLGSGDKIRAFIGTLLALILGLAAFGYAISRLYEIVVVTHATAAKVAAPLYTIAMPRDGTFFALVKEGDIVKTGQPLGSFQTSLLDVVEGVPGGFKMTPEQLAEIVGQQLKGSLASPCDCVVQKAFVRNAQYLLRNQSVMQLVPADAKPYVLARFHYEQIKKLTIGRTVYYRVSGESERVSGKITELRVLPAPTLDANGLNDLHGLNTNAAITDVIAVIEPTVPMPLTRIDEPVEVLIDPLFDQYR